MTDPTPAVHAVIRAALASGPRCGRTRVVAVDGPSGSGKSVTADLVAAQIASLTGVLPQIVHLDDLFPGWDGLPEAVGLLDLWILQPLAAGADGQYRRYDWDAGEYAETVAVPATDWLVVEGVTAGAHPKHLAALLWVEADRDVRMTRGLERDGEAYRPHWERWATQEAEHFETDRTRERADAILRT